MSEELTKEELELLNQYEKEQKETKSQGLKPVKPQADDISIEDEDEEGADVIDDMKEGEVYGI